jgi:hypothetical protein
MRSNDCTRLIEHLAFTACGSTFAQQAAVITVGHETDLVTLWLLCGDKASRPCDLAHFWFRHATERETGPRNCGGVESVQEIGLIFLAVDSGTQPPRAPIIRDGATRIVSRRNRIATEEGTPLPHECAELHRGVAANAGAWCLAALIRRNKGLQDGIGEFLLQVLNVERNAEVVGNATRIVGGIKRATALPVTVTLVGGAMKAHPHTNYVMARLNQECGGHR